VDKNYANEKSALLQDSFKVKTTAVRNFILRSFGKEKFTEYESYKNFFNNEILLVALECMKKEKMSVIAFCDNIDISQDRLVKSFEGGEFFLRKDEARKVLDFYYYGINGNGKVKKENVEVLCENQV
jgi:hypothetical protein